MSFSNKEKGILLNVKGVEARVDQPLEAFGFTNFEELSEA